MARMQAQDPGIGVRFPAIARYFSVLHSVHTGSGSHPYTYSVGNDGFILRLKRPSLEADYSINLLLALRMHGFHFAILQKVVMLKF
jgi:hypothetical protein